MRAFQRAKTINREQKREQILADLLKNPQFVKGKTQQEVEQLVDQELDAEVYINDIYQVTKHTVQTPEGWPEVVWLSIKRRDKSPIHDWRHLQEIKNQIVGEQNEGFELYPAEDRKVDSSNQYHLFVFTDSSVRMPVGFWDRLVDDVSIAGSKQRPFEEEEND